MNKWTIAGLLAAGYYLTRPKKLRLWRGDDAISTEESPPAEGGVPQGYVPVAVNADLKEVVDNDNVSVDEPQQVIVDEGNEAIVSTDGGSGIPVTGGSGVKFNGLASYSARPTTVMNTPVRLQEPGGTCPGCGQAFTNSTGLCAACSGNVVYSWDGLR